MDIPKVSRDWHADWMEDDRNWYVEIPPPIPLAVNHFRESQIDMSYKLVGGFLCLVGVGLVVLVAL